METDDKEKGWGMDQKRCGTDKSGKGWTNSGDHLGNGWVSERTDEVCPNEWVERVGLEVWKGRDQQQMNLQSGWHRERMTLATDDTSWRMAHEMDEVRNGWSMDQLGWGMANIGKDWTNGGDDLGPDEVRSGWDRERDGPGSRWVREWMEGGTDGLGSGWVREWMSYGTDEQWNGWAIKRMRYGMDEVWNG